MYADMRKTFMPVDVSNLKQLSEKRRIAIEELLNVERQFVQSLHVMVKFKRYLHARKNLLSKEESRTIFSCVEELEEIHQGKILKVLEESTTDALEIGPLYYEYFGEDKVLRDLKS